MPDKDGEKKIFENFRNLVPIPEGKLVFQEKPDVVINGATKLGIEITNSYIENGNLKTSEQRQIILRDKVVSKAEEKFLEKGRGNSITILLSMLIVQFYHWSPLQVIYSN